MSDNEQTVGNEWPSAAAPVEDDLDVNDYQHLTTDDLHNVNRRIITFALEGTPTELARKNPKGNGVACKISSQLHDKLRHVMATMDRRKPHPDQLEGDLDRAVLLNAEIIEHSNQFNFPLDIDISALVPITLSSSKASVWSIEPHTPPSMVNVNIFHPTNVVTKRMFDRFERCDMDMLEREFIQPKAGDKSGKMLMAADGVAMAVLRDSPQSFPGLRLPPVNEDTRYIDLPVDVAMPLYDFMKSKIQAVERSFISFKNIEARWTRGDNLAFNAAQNLIGDVAAAQPDQFKEYQNQVLNTHGRASIKVCLDFVLFPKSEK